MSFVQPAGSVAHEANGIARHVQVGRDRRTAQRVAELEDRPHVVRLERREVDDRVPRPWVRREQSAQRATIAPSQSTGDRRRRKGRWRATARHDGDSYEVASSASTVARPMNCVPPRTRTRGLDIAGARCQRGDASQLRAGRLHSATFASQKPTTFRRALGSPAPKGVKYDGSKANDGEDAITYDGSGIDATTRAAARAEAEPPAHGAGREQDSLTPSFPCRSSGVPGRAVPSTHGDRRLLRTSLAAK